jgi:hypothetical protein
MNKGRTPLKNPPLHNPGESLQEQLNELLNDKAGPFIYLLIFMPMWLIYEWLRYLKIYVLPIWAVTTVAVGYIAVSLFKILTLRKEVRNLKRGLLAEKSVGQYLEQFRAEGYQIFHDIPGESGGKKFNLDHVLIGPKGIFTIETKYRQKPEKGRGEVLYDGEIITVQGLRPDRDPVVQAKAQARWLYGLLKDSTGKSIFVKPVVIYPGWWIENKVRDAEVWVVNEKALASFISSQNAEITDSDIHLAAFHLSRYIQSTLK